MFNFVCVSKQITLIGNWWCSTLGKAGGWWWWCAYVSVCMALAWLLKSFVSHFRFRLIATSTTTCKLMQKVYKSCCLFAVFMSDFFIFVWRLLDVQMEFTGNLNAVSLNIWWQDYRWQILPSTRNEDFSVNLFPFTLF